MPMSTYEGIVKNGLVQLDESVQLPEKAKVYVIATNEFVLELDREKPVKLLSPHLANPEDAKKKQPGQNLNQPGPLFKKLEVDVIETEREKLGK